MGLTGCQSQWLLEGGWSRGAAPSQVFRRLNREQSCMEWHRCYVRVRGLASMGRQARMALAGRTKEASSPQVPWMPFWLIT